ncbi:MAG: 4'-phosphopantetheinyl transferase family protein, partial [Rhodobacterales bacterium]
MMQDLERRIAALFGAGVAVAVTDTAAPNPPLLPVEAVAMARAVPQRVAEFTAGRAAARLAMQRLGLPPLAVPAAPDRSPVWPAGLTGSISHAGGICAAVLTRDLSRRIGLDIEDPAPLEPDLWPLVLTPAELTALNTLPPADRGIVAKRVFGIKEAAYKAQFTLTGAVIGFQALEVLPLPGLAGQVPGGFGDDSVNSPLEAATAQVRATDIGTMVPGLQKLFPKQGRRCQIAGPAQNTRNMLIA